MAMQTTPRLQRVPHLAVQTPPKTQRAPHLVAVKKPSCQQLAPHLDLQTAPPLQRVSHMGLSRPTRPRAAACSPGPPYVQLHDLPAADRRRGETAAVPTRHVCGRSRSQERRVAGRSTHGAPSLPRRPGSHPPPPLRAPGLRLSRLQAAGPARPLLRAHSPPWRPPQPSGGRVAAWDKTAQPWLRSGRGLKEGGAPGGRVRGGRSREKEASQLFGLMSHARVHIQCKVKILNTLQFITCKVQNFHAATAQKAKTPMSGNVFLEFRYTPFFVY